MADNILFRIIENPDDKALSEVAVLFVSLYSFVADKGQKNQMITNGENLWINSVRNSLNRTGVLIVAEDNGRVIGFIHGIIRFLPDFLGGRKSGFIAHHYIDNGYRGMGIGKKLLLESEAWFKLKNVNQVEAYVNVGNINSKLYFEKNGYTHETVQLRKFINQE